MRGRVEDLPHLINHFTEKAAQTLGKPVPNVPVALYQWLRNYSFPGNIRELEGMVFDAVARCQGNVLPLQSFKDACDIETLSHSVETSQDFADPAPNWLPERLPTLKEAEDVLIAEALRRADGNQGAAAALLGISRQALNKRLIRRGPMD